MNVEARARVALPRGRATRRKILECAVVAVAETGYANTTTQVILDRSGLSRGSLLHQFATRQDMMIATVETALDDMMAQIEKAMAEAGSVLDGLFNYTDIYWDTLMTPAGLAFYEIQMAARWDHGLLAGLKGPVFRTEECISRNVKTVARHYEMEDVEGYLVDLGIINDAMPGLAARRVLSGYPLRIDEERRALNDWHHRALNARLPKRYRRAEIKPASARAEGRPGAAGLAAGLNVFVFGGAQGAGFGVARAFAKAGAHVAIHSRNPKDSAAAVAELRRLGSVAAFDAKAPGLEGVGAALEAFAAAQGPLDVVVSSAAPEGGPPGLRSLVESDVVQAIHVFTCAQPHLRRPGASLIAVATPLGDLPPELSAHAAAARAGLEQLIRTLAAQARGEGVRINAIAPEAATLADAVQRAAASAARRGQPKPTLTQLRRCEAREDVANVAMFLASPAAAAISGAVVPLNDSARAGEGG